MENPGYLLLLLGQCRVRNGDRGQAVRHDSKPGRDQGTAANANLQIKPFLPFSVSLSNQIKSNVFTQSIAKVQFRMQGTITATLCRIDQKSEKLITCFH